MMVAFRSFQTATLTLEWAWSGSLQPFGRACKVCMYIEIQLLLFGLAFSRIEVCCWTPASFTRHCVICLFCMNVPGDCVWFCLTLCYTLGSVQDLLMAHIGTAATPSEVLQDMRSNYDTDIFGPLLAAVNDLVGGTALSQESVGWTTAAVFWDRLSQPNETEHKLSSVGNFMQFLRVVFALAYIFWERRQW